MFLTFNFLKQSNVGILKLTLGLCFVLSLTSSMAQRTIHGIVKDNSTSEPLIGASVLIEGTNKGTLTDEDGKFSIDIPSENAKLIISYVGFDNRTISVANQDNIEIVLSPGQNLQEIVVTGYGTSAKKDVTGSVASLTREQFQKGQVSSPEQLILGKVAGVQITPGSGAPGSGSRIRIRGGSSLNASNAPLIVIDGVPIDNGGISGVSNPLALINPNEIESFSILKDASSAAIYGSRGANGVILITTKTGNKSNKLNINFSSLNSVGSKVGSVDVLNADEFRNTVKSYTGTIASSADKALVGTANTDWQSLIFRKALTTDNNIAFSGGLKNIPYRLSLGYLNQNGMLKRDNLQRMSANLNVNPSFFNNTLNVKLNGKYANSNSFFANQGAVGAAVYFDPTQPTYTSSDVFGGYFEWMNGSLPNFNAPRNPLGLLNLREDKGKSDRIVGNVQLIYTIPGIEGLIANLNLGMDQSFGRGTVFVPATAAAQFNRGGTNNQYEQNKTNNLLEYYMNYKKDLPFLNSKIDVVGGYSWQDWTTKTPAFDDKRADGTIFEPAGQPGSTQNTLVSFYGRVNYNVNEKYLFTFTMRRDGSSRFSPQARWGNFPSAALAWRLGEENFIKNIESISSLKLRLSWGITGQQDGIADYGYQPNFFYGDQAAQYQFGNTFVPVVRPQGYDANLKWEETETQNAGLDLGLWNDKLTLSADYFIKNTRDLLAVVPVAAGTNFTNNLLTNVGSIKNRGLELGINTNIVRKADFQFDLGFNLTYIMQNEITKLQLVNDPLYLGADVGNTGFNTVQKHTVGYRPNTFFLYKQIYNSVGRPVENFYSDESRNGLLGETDKYWFKNPEPTTYLGFNGLANYKRWNFSFSMRSNIGNYMYNAVKAGSGIYQSIFPNQGYLSNAHSDILNTQFDNRQTWSDYYLENASFLRMDNIALGYNLGRVANSKMNVRLNGSIQNVFVITKYSGLDPEIAGGIDNVIYPRPRVFALGVNLDF